MLVGDARGDHMEEACSRDKSWPDYTHKQTHSSHLDL